MRCCLSAADMLDSGSERLDFRRIQSAVPDGAADHTVVTLERGWSSVRAFVAPAANPKVCCVCGLRCSAIRRPIGVSCPMKSSGVIWVLPAGADYRYAVARLHHCRCFRSPVSTAAGDGPVWRVFDNNLTNRKATRTDATVNFNWGRARRIRRSARIRSQCGGTGWVHASVTGVYTFYTTSDDGVRLWVNNQLLINNWINHGVLTENSGSIFADCGQRNDIDWNLRKYRCGSDYIILAAARSE